MTSTPPTRDRADRSPHRRHRPVHLLVATLAAGSATVLLAGCGAGGTDAAGSAQSAAAAISHAVASAAAAASGAATDIPTPAVTDGATSAGSSGGTGGGGSSATGPCALLSVQQASQLNHVTYSSANSADVGDIGTCDYNPGPGNPEDLTLTVTDDPFCWGALTSTNGPGTTVPGVGDAAFGFSTGMDVKHGGTCIDIAGNTAAESSGDYGPDTAMAQLILQKLG